jgi:hypothetical protein
MKIIFAILFFLAGIGPVEAAERFAVASGGAINATCPIGIPCTLDEAIGGAAAGDTITLRGGTYNERVKRPNAGTSSGRTIIQNYQNEIATIRVPVGGTETWQSSASGKINWVHIKSHDSCTTTEQALFGLIKKCLVFDGIVAGNTGSGPVPLGDNWLIEHVEVKNYNGGAIDIGSKNNTVRFTYQHDNSFGDDFGPPHSMYITCGPNTIQNNKFKNIGHYAIHIFGSSCDNNYPTGPNDGNIVVGNEISKVGQNNAGPAYGAGGFAILLSNGTGHKAYNNIVYNNAAAQGFGGGIQVAYGCTNCEVYNNTIYGESPSAGIQVVSVNSGTIIRNNLIDSITGPDIDLEFAGGTVTRDHNICNSGCDGTGSINTSTPRLADPANADFRLCIIAGNPHPSCTGPSIAIDNGTTISVVTTDFAGTTRPVNSIYDIGAYEAGDPGPSTPTPALVLQISCDNAVTDSSGNNNHGTLTNGATYTATGQYNQGCLFDGINDFINVNDSNSLDLTHGYTLMAWVNATDPITDFRAVLVKNYVYYLYAGSVGISGCAAGGVLAGYDIGTASVNACFSTALTPGTWTHLAARYNRTSIDFFVNGIQVTTIPGSAFMPAGTGALNIGASTFGEFFKGAIDEIRVYNCPLGTSTVNSACAPAGVPQTIALARDTPINALPPTPPATHTFSIGSAGLSLGSSSSALSIK